MTLQQINHRVLGSNLNVLEVTLNPGDTILAEAGALIYMDEGIAYETCLGDGSEPNQGIIEKIFPSSARVLPGDTVFYTYFTNYGRSSGKVLLSIPHLSEIKKISLSDFNNEVILQKGAFLCSTKGVKFSACSNRKNPQQLKEDCINLYRIAGEGEILVSVGGCLIERELNNEMIHLDINSIVAFESGIELAVENRGVVKTMILGNDAFVLGSLKGSGTVYLQSSPLKKMVMSLKTAAQHMNIEEEAIFGSRYKE